MVNLLGVNRFSRSGRKKKGVLVHDSEGWEGGTRADQLAAALKTPGDRPPEKPGGQPYGAGYHAVADEDSDYITLCDEVGIAPFHAGSPFNNDFWSVCIPGKASQTAEQWRDTASQSYVAGTALYIYHRWLADGKAWPLVYRTGAELAKGLTGWSTHQQATISKLGTTNHWDPGPNFPISEVQRILDQLSGHKPPPVVVPPEETDPPQEEEMMKQIRVKGDAATLNVDGLECSWSSSPSVQKALVEAKLVSPEVTDVDRLALAGLVYVSEVEPSYDSIPGYAGGRTKASDFAAAPNLKGN